MNRNLPPPSSHNKSLSRHAISNFSKLPAVFLLAVASYADCLVPASAKPKVAGLEFSIGQPADRPAARVSISELGQGAQKRGFLRVALLPLASVKGLQIRFLLLDPSSLLEIQETIKALTSLDAQEFHNVTFLSAADPHPRLTVEEIIPQKDRWLLKRITWSAGSKKGAAAECHLLLQGTEIGQFVSRDSSQSIPPLQDLLQEINANSKP
jgi:hypothetical protein